VKVDLRTVQLVATKELRESLRDRRTLFVALLLPVLLYPLMMLAVAPLVNLQKQRLKEDAQPIAMTGRGADSVKRLVLDAAEGGAGLAVVPSEDPDADLRAGRIALWLDVPEDADSALVAERTAHVTVHTDGSDDRSITAARKFALAREQAVERELTRRAKVHGMPAEWREPIKATIDDIAPPERRAAYLFGKLLAFILVVLTLSSSFYPAVDSVAGEKERGTMETLLVAPCGRTELVVGKFVAVLTVTLAAAALNLASMALTLGPLGGVIAPDLGAGLRMTPTVLVGVVALLIPLSALFSAVSLALSTLARSVKEGNHYLTPIFLVVMPLAMVVMIPNVPLTHLLAPVPVTNAVLFFRDLLLGKVDAGTTAVVLISTFAYAAAALWACVALFLREETLFRGPQGGTAIFGRPAPRERPGIASALFLFAACMALVWYGQAWLPQDIVRNVLATQFLILFAPCAALTLWLALDPVKTFRVRRPGLVAPFAALAIGLAGPILNLALQRVIGQEQPSETMRKLGEMMSLFVVEHPVQSALAFAVLPAVVEELFFRGFVLSGLTGSLRGRWGTTRAVIVSAALFALFHIFPEKWPPTFLMGLVLGFLAVRTGSIWPGMIAHALNNLLGVLAGDGIDSPEPALVAAAAALMVVGVAGLVVATRERPQLDASPAPR
jgi:sodium transport system permease protein